ncbi:hypothetical protein P154DRAFT_620173 [Amniculicola lignicola CBS 123094]|uniref:Uncharacterized protein n=1 Tax=Amniculicola lignicola CBS 123094 TaxID=1392246 RepID=A0A6A5WHQ1_9PLEO|nr:hypothetical protein P154DRAFT_620173 [Amniculicola lignicola CBS 123094]
MATANGTLTPPSLPPAPPSPAPAKRKRSIAEPPVLSNGASAAAGGVVANGTGRSVQATLRDISTVLQNFDTTPSILNHPLRSTSTRVTSGEAASKRPRLTSPAGPPTLASLVQQGSYDSLEAFEKDVELAASEVLGSAENGELAASQPSPQDPKSVIKALAFRQLAQDLIAREHAGTSQAHGTNGSTDTVNEKVKEESFVEIKQEASDARTVLTLFGSAQGPKQLFSSLQQPVRVPSRAPASVLDTAVKVTLPLRESSLPNILTTTEVYPLTQETTQKKKAPTFGEVFPTPANLTQLSPPKIAKPLTTKANVVSFVPQTSLAKTSRKGSNTYTNQNLSTGHWLGYGGVDLPKDPKSPTAKQKSRQRALSTGEAQAPPSEAILAAAQKAKEDALFRSVYSSFAPSRDDASAIVPEETKNKVWWQRVGEKRYNEVFAIDPALLALDESEDAGASETVEEAESFKDAVENFTPVEASNPFPEESAGQSALDKDTNEVLKEISELLEVLASHQRIRNSSLATNPRTPVVQNSALASLAGSPSHPSSEEIDVYEMLKSQLTLLISQLPPYAVAKLNGDQLDDLNISRTIIIETKESKGVLEEDQTSRYAKSAAINVAVGAPSLSRMNTANTPAHYAGNTPYNRSTPAVHASAARPIQATPAYYPQQQSVHRSPSVHYGRSSSGPTPSYQTPATGYANSTPRASYPAAPGYAQQTPRTSFGQSSSRQYYQQPAQPNYNAPNSQFYQSTPQAQAPTRYISQSSQNGYFPATQNVAPAAPGFNYAAAQSPHGRNGSPLKVNPTVGQSSYRPAYGTPVSGGQMRSSYYGQTAVPQSSQYGAVQPSTPSANPPSGYGAVGSHQQQMMYDRQQAQIAAQSQARMAAAPTNLPRQDSGTPQPGTAQYGGQQVNGAPPMVA